MLRKKIRDPCLQWYCEEKSSAMLVDESMIKATVIHYMAVSGAAYMDITQSCRLSKLCKHIKIFTFCWKVYFLQFFIVNVTKRLNTAISK
jgi:hypothetical protein